MCMMADVCIERSGDVPGRFFVWGDLRWPRPSRSRRSGKRIPRNRSGKCWRWPRSLETRRLVRALVSRRAPFGHGGIWLARMPASQRRRIPAARRKRRLKSLRNSASRGRPSRSATTLPSACSSWPTSCTIWPHRHCGKRSMCWTRRRRKTRPSPGPAGCIRSSVLCTTASRMRSCWRASRR